MKQLADAHSWGLVTVNVCSLNADKSEVPEKLFMHQPRGTQARVQIPPWAAALHQAVHPSFGTNQ